jgi:DNA segregation ATPase FtsK/SpoIIIE-like protein
MSKKGQNKNDVKNAPDKEKSGDRRLLPEHAGEASLRDQIVTVCTVIAALLIILMLMLTNMRLGWSGSKTGVVGYFICSMLYGLFGSAAYLIPAGLLYLALVWRRSVQSGTARAKIIFVGVFILASSTLFYLLLTVGKYKIAPFYNVAEMWKLSIPTPERDAYNRGGVLGALLGGLLYVMLKNIAWVLAALILVGSLLILTEITPAKIGRAIMTLIGKIRVKIAEIKAKRAEKRETEAAYADDRRRINEAKAVGKRARELENTDGADGADGESDGGKLGIKLFPDENGSIEGGGKAEKSVGISPIKYDEIEGSGSAADPKLSKTLPPKLEEGARQAELAAAARTPKVPYDPNPYAVRSESTGDMQTAEAEFSNGSSAPDGSSAMGGSSTEPADKTASADGAANPELIDLLFGGSASAGEKTAETEKSADISTEKSENGEKTEKSGKSGASDIKFEDIADLQQSDENDHALTDPDLADPDELIEKHKHEYKFPPLTLLKKDTGGLNADHSEELKANGVKLVSALESFKVKTKITSISRGPTITRYELLPDQGVRVRAIANLVDDIALNLETSGVRIEAPIPGKPAVGIEVPNRVRETVYLRDLLENPKFGQAGSKVTAALGMDVAGDPIFVDIAKMPHLLIAGTTGSGKSVCINSLITSLLFRATPDEVKLILIDPKKVELGVYNKLPHLLVPVVTNPKKAAGALTWAVGEMEKRYEMIEEAGVRDIKGYNKMVDETGVGEKIPSIIIVIDELADLMMSTPDTVEESICRIAQKARAAGMHLIIGTQRPSVDVITGLIKANIPSRIAFTVRSNVDSRTIIDIAGAEKLIGQGDMLYAPVGAMKPIRVQGAFVSDREVEAICDFIRESSGEGEYDQRAIDEIREKEAECEEIGKKKSAFGSADDDGEVDPKFMECVRVAVESGKISTSLLQRRMGLGYGRAAKIIDRMTEMGIVSAPDGQKPRNVLISMSEYQEMIMHGEEKN